MKKIICIGLMLFLTSFTIVKTNISYKLLFFVDKQTLIGNNRLNLESFITESLETTKKDLTFDLKAKTENMYKNKKAHCVGYTKYFNNLLIKKLKQNNVGNVVVYHARVKVFISGYCVNVKSSPSFKDHDISIIQDNNNGIKYYVDPSLSEVLGDIIIKE